MHTPAYTLPLSRRLLGRYLMFGLAGLFVCISMIIVFNYLGTLKEHLVFAVAASLGLLLLGAVVLQRSVRVNQAIEEQLRQISSVLAGDTRVLQPLAESDSAAIGWNSVIQQLRGQQHQANLEARLCDLSAAGDERQWNRIFHALHEGIAVCDSNDSILMVNNAFSALLGLNSATEVVGKKVLQLLEESVSGMQLGVSKSVLNSASPFVCELRVGKHLADGVWRINRTPVIDEACEKSITLWTIRDITQQKMADEMRNQFVFTATHELRTPLANIKAYAETLAQTSDIGIEDQKRFYNIINNEATRLSRFVDELLDVNQMESGAVTITCGETDLERLLNDVMENLKPQLQQKEQLFEKHFAAKLPSLRLDKDKITAALINLLGNAVKYTPEKGTVRFLVELDDTNIHFHIEDTGIGISAEELPRISEKFFRSSDSRVQSIVGSGLGLAFSQEVARLHRGRISVKSEINKGSRFTLTLPLS